MIACEDEILKEILKSNHSFRVNFEKLLLAFEERMWTKDVCALFKALAKDLFKTYGINVEIDVDEGVSGGRFKIDFLDYKSPTEKKLDRSSLDVVKWFLKR